jgi:hypothetical protein
MTYAYSKLFRQILDSTIWQEDMETKLVFVTMIADCDRFGRVLMSIPGLAKRAGVSLTGCEKALGILLAPDPYSRTKDREGRRIEEIDGGWRLLNHEKYRALRDEEAQRERHARNQAAYLRRKTDRKSDCVTGHVTVSDPIASATTTAKARDKKDRDGGAVAPAPRRQVFTPPTAEEVQNYLNGLGERRFTGQNFVDAYAASGWKLKGGNPMKDWQAAVRNWRSMRDRDGQKVGSQAARVNAWCGACGTQQRKPGSPYCQHCLDAMEGHVCPKCRGENPCGLSECQRCYERENPDADPAQVAEVFAPLAVPS